MKKNLYLTQAAMIAAAYVVLTYVSHIFGLASGIIQFRLSEALTILPFFFPSAIPGLTIGCLLSNLFTGCTVIDIICGAAATFLGAVGVWKMATIREKWAVYASPLFPVFANSIIVALVLNISFPEESVLYLMLTVFIGEFVCCGIFGLALYKLMSKMRLKSWAQSRN